MKIYALLFLETVWLCISLQILFSIFLRLCFTEEKYNLGSNLFRCLRLEMVYPVSLFHDPRKVCFSFL